MKDAYMTIKLDTPPSGAGGGPGPGGAAVSGRPGGARQRLTGRGHVWER
jgi:hypothetical protein